MENCLDPPYLRQKPTTEPVDKNVDNWRFLVEEMWISRDLSTACSYPQNFPQSYPQIIPLLSTGLSTGRIAYTAYNAAAPPENLKVIHNPGIVYTAFCG